MDDDGLCSSIYAISAGKCRHLDILSPIFQIFSLRLRSLFTLPLVNSNSEPIPPSPPQLPRQVFPLAHDAWTGTLRKRGGGRTRSRVGAIRSESFATVSSCRESPPDGRCGKRAVRKQKSTQRKCHLLEISPGAWCETSRAESPLWVEPGCKSMGGLRYGYYTYINPQIATSCEAATCACSGSIMPLSDEILCGWGFESRRSHCRATLPHGPSSLHVSTAQRMVGSDIW